MENKSNILTDTFDRQHSYLRISLTEKCNLRCTYCMPAEGIALSPKNHLMTADEIFTIAKEFVQLGVTKIRLTGGEPFVRKDFAAIVERLATLPVEIAITTNGILLDRYFPLLKKLGIKAITISLDSLQKQKFKQITRRDQFDKVQESIELLLSEDIYVKLNVVLIKDFNDDEILDFIAYTKNKNVSVRFIEFMPFDGNQWNKGRLVSHQEILNKVNYEYPLQVNRIEDAPNDTSRNYQINDHTGKFAIISSVTNPFCDSCNRIRLTADGKIKNCLFSNTEISLLEPLRANESILPYMTKAIKSKFAARGGMDTFEKITDPKLHSQNRSMIAIGG